jgi:polyhydroxyalkanoate synthase
MSAMDNPQYDPAKWLATVFENSQAMMRQMAQMPGAQAAANEPAPEPPPAAAADPFAEASKQMLEMQQTYLRQVTDFWTGVWRLPGAPAPEGVAAAAPAEDRRFAAQAWTNDPSFDAIKQTYLGYSSMLDKAVDAAPVDDKTKGQLRFAARQFSEAMSPTNFFVTNPEAIALAKETGGQSVIEGMRLFGQDLAKGRITMTDESAFEIGRNIAVTEGAVVFENELIQVIQYAPRTAEVYARPLVIVPPAINKFYILDLQPENSLVRYALDSGNTVFLVSWRNIVPELGHLTWDDYLQLGVMSAIDVARDITGADKVNTLGFCVGGTLLASALAVMTAKGEDVVASMTLLTAMLDFSDAGEIGLLVSEQSVAAREQALGNGGVLEGKELGFVFSSLRANDLIWQYVVNSYLKGKAPPAFDLLYWNSDGTNLPGPMFCYYVRNMYLENNLREPGRTTMCDTAVDLSAIAVPAYIYASRDDHIVPWRTAYASNALLSGETTFVLGASGHIAGVINPPAKNKRNYWTSGNRRGDADGWLATAQSIPGSWWPDWGSWLARHAGRRVEARSTPGNQRYGVIEPAPGRYVKARAD